MISVQISRNTKNSGIMTVTASYKSAPSVTLYSGDVYWDDTNIIPAGSYTGNITYNSSRITFNGSPGGRSYIQIHGGTSSEYSQGCFTIPRDYVTKIINEIKFQASYGGETNLVQSIPITVTGSPLPIQIQLGNSMAVTEPSSSYMDYKLPVGLSRPSSATIELYFKVVDGSATSSSSPGDYGFTSSWLSTRDIQTVTFNPGQIANYLSVRVYQDNTKESTENFSLQLQSWGVRYRDGSFVKRTDARAGELAPNNKELKIYIQDNTPFSFGRDKNAKLASVDDVDSSPLISMQKIDQSLEWKTVYIEGSTKQDIVISQSDNLLSQDKITTIEIHNINQNEVNKIDISSVDSNIYIDGNQAFKWIGGKEFSKDATGQLRFDKNTGNILGSIDSDRNTEISIQILGLKEINIEDLVL